MVRRDPRCLMPQPPSLRAAVYWAPALGDPLSIAGNSWLGRDAEHGVAVPQPPLDGLAELTAAARVYGFHATLRPPMRLATGWEDFLASLRHLAAGMSPFALPPLQVVDMAGFLALRERAPCPALHALADACVQATDMHRMAPTESELAKRRSAGLSAEEEALLLRWGYPHVLQHWRFHMTLSRRLSQREMTHIRPLAEAHFAAAAAMVRQVEEVAVFTQVDGGDFLIAERVRLGRVLF
jgi:hypothetical protein